MRTRTLIFILGTFLTMKLWANSREQIPNFLDVARSPDGKVLYMTQSEAKQHCAHQGARLPSARELVQLSMNLGAKGIVDTCGSDKNCAKINYIQNEDGSVDEFYYSSSGYQRPAGDLGNEWFWSSTRNLGWPYTYIVGLFGVDGRVENIYEENKFAVRCVIGL